MGPLMMRLGGLFVPQARATLEMMYQFLRPFEVESGRIERDLGLAATPLEEGLARTVAWYRERAEHGPRRGPGPVTDGGAIPEPRNGRTASRAAPASRAASASRPATSTATPA